MVINELYYGNSPSSVDSANSATFKAEAETVSISNETIAAALINIYRRDFNPKYEIEPNLFNAIKGILDNAVTATGSSGSQLGKDPITQALRHSIEICRHFESTTDARTCKVQQPTWSVVAPGRLLR